MRDPENLLRWFLRKAPCIKNDNHLEARIDAIVAEIKSLAAVVQPRKDAAPCLPRDAGSQEMEEFMIEAAALYRYAIEHMA